MDKQSTPIAVILVTHGTWGQALREVAEAFLGPQQRLTFVPLHLDESSEGLTDKLEQALSEVATDGQALFLVDLRGGTPWNTVAVLTRRKNLQCVSGLNLPMLLEVLVKRDETTMVQLADTATDAGRQGVANLATLLAELAANKKACTDIREE